MMKIRRPKWLSALDYLRLVQTPKSNLPPNEKALRECLTYEAGPDGKPIDWKRRRRKGKVNEIANLD